MAFQGVGGTCGWEPERWTQVAFYVLTAVSFDKYVSMETISLDDTRSSWETLCEAELRKGIRDSELASQHELAITTRNRLSHQ